MKPIEEADLDKMFFPKANPMEELETLSEDKFRTLFDAAKFEYCTKDKRDKGIDLTYEIKRNGQHIGFRFIVQLKSTDSIEPNKTDGSYSVSIDTSNINLLWCSNHPAFYVLYVVNTDTFYYESVHGFVKHLNEKDNAWRNKGTHTLRFNKLFLPNGPTEMYDTASKNGLFQLNLKERTTIISASVNKNDRIMVDADFTIVDDANIRMLVEELGFKLLNQGKCKEILEVHQNATGNVATTALYNLILGIANYYGGSRWDAISFFKKASNLKSDLNKELKMHLEYFDAVVRYAVDQISEEDYNRIMLNLEKSETVGLYIKLDNAKHNYFESLNKNSGYKFEQYVKDIEEIINDPKANDGIKLTAKCELILFQGFKNNSDFIKDIARINVEEEIEGPNLQKRIEYARKLMELNKAWYQNVEVIIKDAEKCQNDFAYHTALINEVKVSYQFMIYASLVTVEKPLIGYPAPVQPDRTAILDVKLKRASLAANYFNQIGHIENAITAYSTMYEIFRYINDLAQANDTMNKLEILVDKLDSRDYKRRLEYLKNGGTTQETFKNWIAKIYSNAEASKKEFDDLRFEMVQMDEAERVIPGKSQGEHLHIDLFPIGYFQFDKNQKELVYEILKITNSETRKAFDQLFEFAIPVANIYNNPIEKEGYEDGNFANKGIESFRNIHRIRKAFFENKFYRSENI